MTELEKFGFGVAAFGTAWLGVIMVLLTYLTVIGDFPILLYLFLAGVEIFAGYFVCKMIKSIRKGRNG